MCFRNEEGAISTVCRIWGCHRCGAHADYQNARAGPALFIGPGCENSLIRVLSQAFVVFDDIAGATSAIRALNKFVFCGRPLVSVSG